MFFVFFFFFQAEDGIRDKLVTGVQTCALPIWSEIQRLHIDIRSDAAATKKHPSGRSLNRGAGLRRGSRRRWRQRSEERRVGKECRTRGGRWHKKRKRTYRRLVISIIIMRRCTE